MLVKYLFFHSSIKQKKINMDSVKKIKMKEANFRKGFKK